MEGRVASEEDASCLGQTENSSSESEDTKEECQYGDKNSGSSSESESDEESEDASADKSSIATAREEIESRILPEQASESEFYGQHLCEHCMAKNNQVEKLIPRNISKEQFLLRIEDEGTYQCSVTGLIFEVTRKAHIKYSVLSWSKFAVHLREPWTVGGPIFDVHCDSVMGGPAADAQCDSAVLKSIQFPHSLCLHDHKSDLKFKVLHIKGMGSEIEPSVDYSPTHVKWLVTSLSPVGPIMQNSESICHHGAVLLYKVIDNNPSLFRVYVIINNSSFIKDVRNAIKGAVKKFIQIDKPPACQKLLKHRTRYRFTSEPEAEINPENIEFIDDSPSKLKNYTEVFFEQPEEFKLSLTEMDSDEIIWNAKLRMCDWETQKPVVDAPKNSTNCRRRRRLSNFTEEEFVNKRARLNSDDETHCTITDQQLMDLAKKLGKEWPVLGVSYLGINMNEIEHIKYKNEELTIQKFKMLALWREKSQKNGTIKNLHNCLKDRDDVGYELLQTLEGFLNQACLEDNCEGPSSV
uniref:Caspase recruitment domain-containing protein 8 isoform X2 n=1 Tax=Geotrypetes seraphini TaxID=260995 RepID=A0A6P8SAB0_GEOSA|nr:caspase recruitment domain-containing protein 8 isoform X2 [Geotrypetes seraphini]